MKILLLGHGGFIGSRLYTYLLSNNYKLITMDRQMDILRNNILFDFIRTNKPHIVINCISFGGKTELHNTDLQLALDNLSLFTNLIRASKYFKKFINIGSGAEFREYQGHVKKASEDEIWKACPKFSSYAGSKNIIARLSIGIDNFYTLRLFGCFGKGEPNFRIFTAYKNALINKTPLEISDKYFDNLYVEDFCKIVEHYVNNDPAVKNINCVYKEKLKLSQQLELMSFINKWPRNFIVKEIGKDYTGCSKNLEDLNLDLVGLSFGMSSYK